MEKFLEILVWPAAVVFSVVVLALIFRAAITALIGRTGVR
jgi:hypothetical protein